MIPSFFVPTSHLIERLSIEYDLEESSDADIMNIMMFIWNRLYINDTNVEDISGFIRFLTCINHSLSDNMKSRPTSTPTSEDLACLLAACEYYYGY